MRERESATGGAAGARCRWSARVAAAAGAATSKQRPSRCRWRGEGTVGVLAPGDRDAQGLEGYRYTADLSNESGARSGPARRNLRDLCPPDPPLKTFRGGSTNADRFHRVEIYPLDRLPFRAWHRSASPHRRERNLHVGTRESRESYASPRCSFPLEGSRPDSSRPAKVRGSSFTRASPAMQVYPQVKRSAENGRERGRERQRETGRLATG